MAERQLARLEPADVKAGLDAGTVLLIDVREPHEFVQARIPGSLLFPLSTFEARCLPDPGEKQLIFSCRSGRRSVTAFNDACAGGLNAYGHLEGGIIAWVNAGYAVVETDESGQPRIVGG